MDIQKILRTIQGMGKTAVKTVTAPLAAPIDNIASTIHEYSYSPQTIPQDWKYREQLLATKRQQNPANLIQVPYGPNKAQRIQMNQYQKATPDQRLAIDSILDGGIASVKNPSADYIRYNLQAPPEDARGKALKEKILANPAFYPGERKYLASVPVSAEKQLEQGSAAFFTPQATGDEFVRYDPRLDEGRDAEVLSHELMHAATNVFGKKELGNFVVDVARAYQANPQKFEPIMRWIGAYKNDPRFGDGYFKRNSLQEANELFAQIGAVYGPEMSNDPILGKYYSRVFNNRTPEANPPPETVYFEDGSSRPATMLDRQRLRLRPVRSASR